MLAEIDGIINVQIGENEPGVALAIVKNGEVLHCKGYGLAHLEWNQPVGPDTVFYVASLTKQFTASAILLLEQQGKLRTDDLITKYLPNYPTHEHEITIAHLLSHTSGIFPYNEVEGFFEHYCQYPLSHEAALALFQDVPLQFEPGTRFRYNNSGYYLLGLIIEAITGKSYEEFLRGEIFLPLNMSHTYYMHNESIIPRRAEGYIITERGCQHRPYLDMSVPYAGGALGSTLEDMVRWETALYTGSLLNRESLERMYTPVQLANGDMATYGFGWHLESYRGHRMAHHSGDMAGFLCFMVRFLDDGITIILLSNGSNRNMETLLRQVAQQVLGLSPLKHEPVVLEERVLKRVLGTYAINQHVRATIVQEGEKIMLPLFQVELLPLNEQLFCFANDHEIEVRFSELGEQGFATMTVHLPFQSFSATRVANE
jgi:CubicO group peptidase (beta-lactamase class C family)